LRENDFCFSPIVATQKLFPQNQTSSDTRKRERQQRGEIMLKKLKLALATGTVLLVCANAFGQNTKTVEAGWTSVKLSGDLVTALQTLGVTPGTITPSKLRVGKVNFPATAGAIDLKSLKGEIVHSGGLTLTAGNTQVRLQTFTIDTTGAAPVLTGLVTVNGALLGRVPLFDINLSGSSIRVNDGILTISKVGLTLNKVAAAALNQAFGVNAFSSGSPVGSGKVIAALDGSNEDHDSN
jgi:hypothetical protein